MEAFHFLHRGLAGPGYTRGGWLWGRYPWMTVPYVGGLETYLFAGVFKLFGLRLAVIRLTTVLLGATALWFASRLVCRLYGGAVGFGFGIWLATDPALVLVARHDYGQNILTMALKLAALWWLWSGEAERSRLRLFVGGTLLGLCLWDKAQFLWLLAGLGAATALCVPARHWRRVSIASPVLLGFAVGAAPFLLYNILRPLDTLAAEGLLEPGRFAAQWAGFLPILRQRLSDFGALLDGTGYAVWVSGEIIQPPAWRARILFGVAAAAIVGLTVAPEKIRVRALRHGAFWMTAMAVSFLCTCATPLGVSLHHFPLLYPLPQLAAAALLSAAAGASVPWMRRFGLALGVAGFGAAMNLTVLGGFYRAIRRTGGGVEWYDGAQTVARICEAAGGRVATLSFFFEAPLTVYSQGQLTLWPVYGDFLKTPLPETRTRILSGLSRSGTLVVLYLGSQWRLSSAEIAAQDFFDRQRAADPERWNRLAAVAYSDGRPWAEIFQAR